MRTLTTRSVSKRGTISIAKPIAGADCKGKPMDGSAATAINFMDQEGNVDFRGLTDYLYPNGERTLNTVLHLIRRW